MRGTGQVPRPRPLPRLHPAGSARGAQEPVPPLRPPPAPAPRRHLRGLRPPGRPPPGEDRQLPAVRRAAPQCRPRPLQPLQARRPGLALPLRNVSGSPASGHPGLVAGTDRVRCSPPPSRRRRRDPPLRRPRPAERPLSRPRQITDSLIRPDGTPTAEGRALTAFFAGSGLTLPGDQASRRAAVRRQRFLDAVPEGLAAAVAAFSEAQLADRERDRRAGRRLLSDITLETRLRILRDLAGHLSASGRITSWTEVTTADLERFLAGRARSRHQDTYVLRRYFAWARRRKLILIDPARPLRLGPQPGFTGTVLDAGTQRSLLNRWTSDGTRPHERLAGLLALLHAASNAEIRGLAVTGIDDRKRTVTVPGRPFPVPADPASWDAVPGLPALPGPARHPQPAPDRHEGDQDGRCPR